MLHRSMVILVVDDDPQILKLLQISLEEDGYKVLAAQHGEQALKFLEDYEVDLILSDVVMPNMDGLELVQAVKRSQRSAQIPFLFFSAQNEMDDRLKGLELGANDYISKPINPIEVRLRVRNILKQQAVREERQQDLVAGALDLIRLGIVILRQKGKVKLMNRAARKIVESRDGLYLQQGVLTGRTVNDTKKIAQLVEETLSLVDHFDPAKINPVRLGRPSHKADYALIAVPMELSGELNLGRDAITLVIHDPETTPVPPIDLLIKTYQFTQAEARVASLLIQGRAVNEIVDELGVSRNTVATHLKKLYLKTDTQRQSDFTRLLLSGLPQLHLD